MLTSLHELARWVESGDNGWGEEGICWSRSMAHTDFGLSQGCFFGDAGVRVWFTVGGALVTTANWCWFLPCLYRPIHAILISYGRETPLIPYPY